MRRELGSYKRLLTSFITEELPQFSGSLRLVAEEGSLVNRINEIRRGIKGLVGDPQFDSKVPAVERGEIPEYTLRRVTAAASNLVSYVDDRLESEQEQFAVAAPQVETIGDRIFIVHGHSRVWRDLKDFLQERLGLLWDEFNRESTAGVPHVERLERMLDDARFAFLVMTAEEEHADQALHARENVIHEAGLFQGRLGFRKAIILLEEGCKEFSNIHGLGQIRFPRGNVLAKSEDIRGVLEREGLL